MAWEQLSIDKPHVAYIILGGFTSLFMLCSLFVKEKLYIGEATVATICGVIFGPHAANLFNPQEWGNVDKITLECSRIVLVVQCFAVGVELPKAYMERHWRSVTFLLVPVMTFGWLITSLIIWWMIVPLSWLESLVISACVTATDPVLASSVVGKGKFAKRVPKHLRDVLSAESGCNDGMAFPFIYLSLYLLRYDLNGRDVVFHWFCFTVLYECIFGAVFGFMVGYIGRHLIKTADRLQLIDRESFLVFYFVLALFCAGTGSLLGMDDLLIGFAAGVGFSNDGWFTQKTEEAHVSNVIDLLLNLAYFVYFGSIVPWEQFNNIDIGLVPWRLVVISIFVILFRRIPAMLAFKPAIPDVKNWREALFAGHFGPIGVGAVFAAILARAELETDSTQPLAVIPDDPHSEEYLLIHLIWPVVTFLVVSSIIVHGSSIAVFTLGKRINTLTLTMSYTQANEPSWLNRLPRISSVSRSMSRGKDDDDSSDTDEKLPFPPGTLGPVGFPGNLLRRQKEEDNPSRAGSRSSSLRPTSRRKKYPHGEGPGGPISQSAIAPQRIPDTLSPGSARRPSYAERQKSDRSQPQSPSSDVHVEAYKEGDHMITEDAEGNVLADRVTKGESREQELEDIEEDREKLARETSGEHAKHKGESHEKNEGEEIEKRLADEAGISLGKARNFRKRLENWNEKRRKDTALKPVEERLRGPAHAYQYGNTIIVEDEDGEVVRKYDIPATDRKKSVVDFDDKAIRKGLHRMGTWTGLAPKASAATDPESQQEADNAKEYEDDDRIRFRIGSSTRRMSKQDFIKQIQTLDPSAKIEAIQESEAPEEVKEDATRIVKENDAAAALKSKQAARPKPLTLDTAPVGRVSGPIDGAHDSDGDSSNDNGLTQMESYRSEVPYNPMSDTLAKFSIGKPETAAQQRRRRLARRDSDDDGTERVPPGNPVTERDESNSRSPGAGTSRRKPADPTVEAETAAERRRRLAALGHVDDSSDSEEDGKERQPKRGREPVKEPVPQSPRSPTGIRFADTPSVSIARSVQWAEHPGRSGGSSSKKK